MPDQICPNCHKHNPWENNYCGHCGTALNRYTIVPSQLQLPIPAQKRWQVLAQAPLVQAATVSLGAIMLRTALAWLLRRGAPRQTSYWPATFEHSPSRAIFEAGQGFLPRRSGPFRIITLAWWMVRLEEPAQWFEDE